MGNKKKKMIVIKLNPEKEIGFTVTDGATNKVIKTGSSKVKDKVKFSTGGDTMLKGKQKKLDKNKDGKISGEDFKMMKAKYGKMMKASEGSMTFSEGSTNKVRGTGIAVKGTNFKGIF